MYWLVILGALSTPYPIGKYETKDACEAARREVADFRSDTSLAYRSDAAPRYDCLYLPRTKKPN